MDDPPIGSDEHMRRTVDDAIAGAVLSANCELAGHPLRVERDRDMRPVLARCRCQEQVWEIPSAKELERLRELAKILGDLDRCEHGRHRIDNCWSCPEGPPRNWFMPGPGERVGTDLAGRPYYMPSGDRPDPLASMSEPEAWRRAPVASV